MNYFNDYQVIGICGAAWGDEGKGKFTDFFARNADIIIRAQGGNNAGHTVKANGKTLKLHIVPSGIIYSDKINIIGNGVVVDVFSLVENEINVLENSGINCSNLKISGDSHLIMPYHKLLDFLASQKKIGTTGRGIGPSYRDKIDRVGLRTGEFYYSSSFVSRLENLCDYYNKLFKLYDVSQGDIENFLTVNPIFKNIFSNNEILFQPLYDLYKIYAEKIKKYICNHREILFPAVKQGKKILLEGAQGLLLDVDHGTYPYVTSSNACAGGLSTGTGISPENIDRIFSVNGAYLTRVGNGPFPSELGNYKEIESENLANRMSADQSINLMKNAESDYERGKAVRHLAGEFGTTTGRPRRVGWADIPSMKYCASINGADFIITKFDVLDFMPVIKVVRDYKYTGDQPVFFNGQTIAKGDIIKEFPGNSEILEKVEPASYVEFEGWMTSTTDISDYESLPENAKKYIKGIEELAQINIRILSVGPKREDTICIK